MVNYFQNLFAANAGDPSPILDCVNCKVSASQNAALVCPVKRDEVHEALFAMHPDKSPGPDGMSPGFDQHFWDIMGSDIVLFCDTFIRSGQLLNGVNHTHIALIPKKQNPTCMTDLRPISLCNVIYKIAAKVLANRLKPLLNSLISKAQSAFVPNRLISDNIMLAFKAQHFFKRKTQGKNGFSALKLDLSKAFDRVEWSYLRSIMLKMGFCEAWVSLIWNCISNVSYHVLADGAEIGPIVPCRGG